MGRPLGMACTRSPREMDRSSALGTAQGSTRIVRCQLRRRWARSMSTLGTACTHSCWPNDRCHHRTQHGIGPWDRGPCTCSVLFPAVRNTRARACTARLAWSQQAIACSGGRCCRGRHSLVRTQGCAALLQACSSDLLYRAAAPAAQAERPRSSSAGRHSLHPICGAPVILTLEAPAALESHRGTRAHTFHSMTQCLCPEKASNAKRVETLKVLPIGPVLFVALRVGPFPSVRRHVKGTDGRIGHTFRVRAFFPLASYYERIGL